MPSWGISELRCQLCWAEPGTEMHRYDCTITKPKAGWSEAPPKAQLALKAITPLRRHMLRKHGILVMKVPTPPRPEPGTFTWLTDPPDSTAEGLRWYSDGSSSDPTAPSITALGFALVVTSSQGDLVAFGWGVPPNNVLDSAAAEAWAIGAALMLCPRRSRS